jgi:antirestriction protein ArdC
MKTTLEIPEHISPSQVGSGGARDPPLREFVTEAIKDKLAASARTGEQPWVKPMGKLKHLHRETQRINHLIEEDFKKIDVEMWR